MAEDASESSSPDMTDMASCASRFCGSDVGGRWNLRGGRIAMRRASRISIASCGSALDSADFDRADPARSLPPLAQTDCQCEASAGSP
eukprot:2346180-Rhodomonas_salina.6